MLHQTRSQYLWVLVIAKPMAMFTYNDLTDLPIFFYLDFQGQIHMLHTKGSPQEA